MNFAANPAAAPDSSNCSAKVNCKSNFANSVSGSTPETDSPGNSKTLGAMFWNVRTTCTSGCRACERSGSSTSTSCSNGMSLCANAPRSAVRTRSSSASNESSEGTSARSTRVLTNIPIMSSSARSPRPATGVPIAMSDVPDSLAQRTASAACATMNNDARCSRAITFMASLIRRSIRNAKSAPRFDATFGRTRSAGRSRTSGAPANVCVQ